MKKIELTKKQKKILKTVVIAAGGTVCVVAGTKIISRTKLGEAMKDKIIDWMVFSKCRANGCVLEMTTFVAGSVCSDAAVIKKAHNEAHDLWKSILEAKDAG